MVPSVSVLVFMVYSVSVCVSGISVCNCVSVYGTNCKCVDLYGI